MNKPVYINLVPITTGGGLQNAASFLETINKQIANKDGYLFIVKKNTTLESICIKHKLRSHIISNSRISRILFECLFFFNKRDAVIFTLFGPKPILTYRCFNIVGCAYSNLFYPQIAFWSYLPWHSRFIKWLTDKYRYFFTRSADVVIFETEHLRQKAKRISNFRPMHTYHVPMAVSALVNEETGGAHRAIYEEADIFKILYLGSSHPNKRQHLLIDITRNLINAGYSKFKFITTMGKNSYSDAILTRVKNLELAEYIQNIGVVPVESVAEIINGCNAMINIAVLESFSNNFVEAWSTGKLLIVTNDYWAKAAIDNGAVYIDPTHKDDYLPKFSRIFSDNEYNANIVDAGYDQLKKYPKPANKVGKYLDIINKYA